MSQHLHMFPCDSSAFVSRHPSLGCSQTSQSIEQLFFMSHSDIAIFYTSTVCAISLSWWQLVRIVSTASRESNFALTQEKAVEGQRRHGSNSVFVKNSAAPNHDHVKNDLEKVKGRLTKPPECPHTLSRIISSRCSPSWTVSLLLTRSIGLSCPINSKLDRQLNT